VSKQRFKKIITILLFFLLGGLFSFSQEKEKVIIIKQADTSPRIELGLEKLLKALQGVGYSVSVTQNSNSFTNIQGGTIVVGELNSGLVQKAMSILDLSSPAGNLKKEGYSIISSNKNFIVGGADASGVLYGCLELADEIKKNRKLPPGISITDQPEMVLRGTCIGLQKPYYLPGRNVYEYPYTPETFPWFYDKKLWVQVLDSMLENRMNSLYLWNGHPFASLVKLKDYPYAVEVDEATFKKNEEMYRFIAKEADIRGIWIIQMFYNIIVSKPFAEKNKIKTQDRERHIVPLIADYTRKSIAAFVEKYPNVGLMVCLGEAMEGIGNDDVEWFTKTIIPGVLDGLKASGKKEEPPIVLRAHDTDAPSVMKAALPLYKNLYTEAKFNGEALTTPTPRGEWAKLHQTLSKLGSVHIENVHILANLEPFRYCATGFIQLCVKGMHEIMGGNGLHLYPQASYWDWPYTADSVKARPDDPVGRGKRLLQIERDWIWYKAWGRYAWKVNRNYSDEVNYWAGLLADRYGCSVDDAKNIMDACEHAGEIAPVLLRRFGITDGNRQTLTLGMLMTQLINPYRYGLFKLLYDSEGPEGEMLIQYAEKEWKGEKHVGETPPDIINKVRADGTKSVYKIELAAPHVTKNKDEFNRLTNDIHCYRTLAFHFAEKAEAALAVLRYKYSNDVNDLERALPHLEKSVSYYQELVNLTKGTYLYANSMQTQQRKIPLRGINGSFKTWAEVLVPFEDELQHFKRKIDSLKNPATKTETQRVVLTNADIRLFDTTDSRYIVDSLSNVFSDTSLSILDFARELKGLRGVQLSFMKQLKQGTELRFSSSLPVKLLVGYFNPQQAAFSKDSVFLKAPELETNAAANDYGQAEIKIANAIVIKGMPPVNVHSYNFPAGNNVLKLARGICLILGFVNNDELLPPYDAGLTESGNQKQIDWLFE
jgi:hypothetical protein